MLRRLRLRSPLSDFGEGSSKAHSISAFLKLGVCTFGCCLYVCVCLCVVMLFQQHETHSTVPHHLFESMCEFANAPLDALSCWCFADGRFSNCVIFITPHMHVCVCARMRVSLIICVLVRFIKYYRLHVPSTAEGKP